MGLNVEREKLGILAGFVGLFLGWGLLILQLRYHWGGETYYNYGWGVPFAAAFLIYRRGKDAPKAERSSRSLWIIGVLLVLAAIFALTPFRLLSEVNPFWRKPLLLQSFLLVGASLAYVWAVAGRRVAWHFAFPIVFLLTMVPWPYQMEVFIIQGLTQKVVALTTGFLHLMGYPAVVMGNTIQIGESTVGVDEACSGIRSLQALGMIALFLGEFYRLNVWRRTAIIAVTLLMVFVFNSARSIALTLIVVHHGHDAYDKWHDPVGYISFGAGILVMYLISDWLDRRAMEAEAEAETGNWGFALPRVSFAWIGWLVPVAAVVVGVGVETWFRVHEAQTVERASWDVDWPEELPEEDFSFLPVPKGVESLLSYDYGFRARFRLRNFRSAEMYYYGYDGEDRMASVSSYGHSPQICMEAAGAHLIEERAPFIFRVEGIEIPLRHFLFSIPEGDRDRVVNVFWCVWENNNMGIDPDQLASLSFGMQWKQALVGRRDYSRQVLLTVIHGATSPASARDSLEELLSGIIEATLPEATELAAQ